MNIFVMAMWFRPVLGEEELSKRTSHPSRTSHGKRSLHHSNLAPLGERVTIRSYYCYDRVAQPYYGDSGVVRPELLPGTFGLSTPVSTGET